MAAQIHVNDIGTSFRAAVTDEQGSIVTLNISDTLKILFGKPDGTTVVKDAVVYDGALGIMQYITQAGDLDMSGNWKVQGFVKQGLDEFYGEIVKVKIWPNVAIAN